MVDIPKIASSLQEFEDPPPFAKFNINLEKKIAEVIFFLITIRFLHKEKSVFNIKAKK